MQEPTQSEADRETDELAEHFFSQPPEAWEVEPEPETWRPAPLSRHERLAMFATLAPVAIGASVAIGLFLFSDPLFAAAEAGSAAPDEALAAAPRVEHDSTHHGLTALAKAAPSVPALEPTTVPALEPSAEPVLAASPVAASPEPALVAVPIASAAAAAPVATTVAPAPKRAAIPAAVREAAAARPASEPRAAVSGSSLKRARQALDAGKPLEARTLAAEAIAKSPTAAAGYIVLAGALDALGDRAAMQATFRSCAERATDSLASACRSLAR